MLEWDGCWRWKGEWRCWEGGDEGDDVGDSIRGIIFRNAGCWVNLEMGIGARWRVFGDFISCLFLVVVGDGGVF